MSFIPQNTPFVSLPTALKGKIDPYQLTVLWVMQSYYPNIYPSYATLAKDAGMSRTKVILVVEQLCSKGWLQKETRFDEHGNKTNTYRVTVWHECKVPNPDAGSMSRTTPHPEVSDPSYEAGYMTRTSTPDALPQFTKRTRGGTPDVPKLKQVKLKQLTKTNEYSEEFNIFWNKYLKIKKRASSQSKKLAWEQYQKIEPKMKDGLLGALITAIQEQQKIEKDGGFATTFPDCFRWLRDGKYEAYFPETKIDSVSQLNNSRKNNDLPF